jgi:hypothetical protein
MAHRQSVTFCGSRTRRPQEAAWCRHCHSKLTFMFAAYPRRTQCRSFSGCCRRRRRRALDKVAARHGRRSGSDGAGGRRAGGRHLLRGGGPASSLPAHRYRRTQQRALVAIVLVHLFLGKEVYQGGTPLGCCFAADRTPRSYSPGEVALLCTPDLTHPPWPSIRPRRARPRGELGRTHAAVIRGEQVAARQAGCLAPPPRADAGRAMTWLRNVTGEAPPIN